MNNHIYRMSKMEFCTGVEFCTGSSGGAVVEITDMLEVLQ